MIKKFVTLVGILISGLSHAAGSTNNGGSFDPANEELKKEVQEACGHITDPGEFDLCVQIVEMEFTVVPQGCTTTGGTGTCPECLAE